MKKPKNERTGCRTLRRSRVREPFQSAVPVFCTAIVFSNFERAPLDGDEDRISSLLYFRQGELHKMDRNRTFANG